MHRWLLKTSNWFSPAAPQNAINAREERLEMRTRYSTTLPAYDKCEVTRMACIVAIIASGIACLICLVVSIDLFVHHGNDPFNQTFLRPLNLSSGGAEVVALVVNLVMTGCIEGLGYIHATSLRWALYEENRLEYNTNLRLFTNSRSSGPNRWYMNIIFAGSLILCYASTSLIVLRESQLVADAGSAGAPGYKALPTACVNPVALCGVLVGLLTHIVIAVWCVRANLKYIPTWSSNPLNNTLAALHGRLNRRPGRCMMALSQGYVKTEPVRPLSRQQSFRKCRSGLSKLSIFVWCIAVLMVTWAVSVCLVIKSASENDEHIPWTLRFSWSPKIDEGDGEVQSQANYFQISILKYKQGDESLPWPLGLQCFVTLLLVCAIQAPQTLGLHIIELVVNVSRDEQCWRDANRFYGGNGAQLKVNALVSALRSWEYLLLFLMKTVLHWLIGQSLQPSFVVFKNIVFEMIYPRLFVTASVEILLAGFVTYLIYRRPSGPQPAAWGHLQTLADLVDAWDLDERGRMFWGDKGVDNRGVHHAGTSPDEKRIGSINPYAVYASGCCALS